MPYFIEQHKHRYSAWAASRAASTSTCRFSVQQGKHIIESAELDKLVGIPKKLPGPNEIDTTHRAWRESAIRCAKELRLIGFSHGVAAKLINVYLKGIFVCGGHEDHPHVAALHPPIDSLLLDGLCKSDEPKVMNQRMVWENARRIRWSKFSSQDYEDVVSAIRIAMAGEPLWQAEEYWPGNR